MKLNVNSFYYNWICCFYVK